jgi:hypothetical protein
MTPSWCRVKRMWCHDACDSVSAIGRCFEIRSCRKQAAVGALGEVR